MAIKGFRSSLLPVLIFVVSLPGYSGAAEIPTTLTLDYNNYGSRYVSGRSRFGATLEAGNLLTEGSNLKVRAVTGTKTGDLFYGRVAYSVPLNNSGTRLGAYYADGDYEVGREFSVINVEGATESYGLLVSHPFIKARLYTLTGELGYHATDGEQTVLNGAPWSEDKTRTVKAGLVANSNDESGKTAGAIYLTQGLGDNFGAMDDNDPMASRLGADNSFTKVSLDMMRLQRLSPSFFMLVKGSGQYTNDSLVVSEQFSIGGANSVRGFNLAEQSGDRGYAVTAELRVAPLSDKNLFQIVAFIDHGAIDRERPVAGQDDDESLAGAGGGIRMSFPNDINLRAEAGYPLHPSKADDGHNAIYYLEMSAKF